MAEFYIELEDGSSTKLTADTVEEVKVLYPDATEIYKQLELDLKY